MSGIAKSALLATRSRMSLTRPAGRTSNKLSMLSSPISGKSIRSLLLAKKPAAMMPNRLPRRNIAVVFLLRVLAGWRAAPAFLLPFAGLLSRGVGVSEGDGEGVRAPVPAPAARRRSVAGMTLEALNAVVASTPSCDVLRRPQSLIGFDGLSAA